jgi:glycosyltransferase involved in cell wall biosynthesis
VNLRKGGTLTILRDCLQYLSSLTKEYRVVALVHKRELCDFMGIEYIEMPDIIKGWGKRLWCEYATMHRISKELAPVYLWLSLHDTSPRVKAERQAVYCQTSFPFYQWTWRDFRFDFKIPLFACFTRFAYRVNVHSNRYLIVQQEWLRKGLSKMLGVRPNKFIVAPPQRKMIEVNLEEVDKKCFTFFYASTPDCHKNFETLCKAAALLEKEVGVGKFKVVLTIKGDENKYAAWLKKNWGNVHSIEFAGFMSKECLYGHYLMADCLVFPSKVETWGLPISEYMETGKPMLLADLPYAHETAAGSKQTFFFPATHAETLKNEMKKIWNGDMTRFVEVPFTPLESPKADSWHELFDILLKG